jgi:hypothetical protein
MPHFENSQAVRGAPILSGSVTRDFGNRDHLGWQHLRLIRERWQGRLVLKGVMAVDDALAARDCGVDGLIVSNHGGRQLDGAVSPIAVLPAIVQAVGELPVMMDSGVRRGNDVLKALALGAKFVFVGRPFNYAASVAGEAGVRHGIDLLQQEIHRNMALLGISRLDQVRERPCRPGARAAILRGMRSKLFVPGSRPELFAKALAGAADAISDRPGRCRRRGSQGRGARPRARLAAFRAPGRRQAGDRARQRHGHAALRGGPRGRRAAGTATC